MFDHIWNTTPAVAAKQVSQGQGMQPQPIQGPAAKTPEGYAAASLASNSTMGYSSRWR